MTTPNRNRRIDGMRLLAPLLLVAGLFLPMAPALAQQAHFPSAEAARDAFVQALSAGDLDQLAALFGPEHQPQMLGDDTVAAQADVAQAARLAAEAVVLRPDGPSAATLMLGRMAWPFPVPLVQDQGGWRFDTLSGLEEIVDRRIGRNELAVLEVMRAFVDAQHEYGAIDRDGDQVLEYAQRLQSTGDLHDGLYWPTGPGETPSPFGPFIAGIDAYLEGRQQGDPYHGYYFRVLTRQGDGAPGGAYDYVINGNMVAGFGLLAWPSAYGDTGIMSFMVGPNGVVLEKDLGEGTAGTASAMTGFDPDPDWRPAED